MSVLGMLLNRLGVIPKRKGRGVVVWGDSTNHVLAIAPALRDFYARFPQVNIFLSGPPRVVRALEKDRVPGLPMPAPFPAGFAAQLFFERSKIHLCIVAGTGMGGEFLLTRAAELGVPILLCHRVGRTDGGVEPVPWGKWLAAVAAAFASDEHSRQILRQSAVPPEIIGDLPMGDRMTPAATRILGQYTSTGYTVGPIPGFPSTGCQEVRKRRDDSAMGTLFVQNA